jgi:RHS repeat-associated protein
MVTDATANVVARHDYLPFGEEIPAGYAGRGSQWGAGAPVNQKFTGQERDVETGLDYFLARYMSAAQGRFLSPDPMNAGADPMDPQSWNAYAYVRGNPLNLVDPSGMGLEEIGGCYYNVTTYYVDGEYDSSGYQLVTCTGTNGSSGLGNYPQIQPPLPPAPVPFVVGPIDYSFPQGGVFARGRGKGPRKGERKTAAKPSGTPNPGKHVRPSRTHPGQWEIKDPHTGNWKLKPPGWTPTQGRIIEGTLAVTATVTGASLLSEILEGLGIAAVAF